MQHAMKFSELYKTLLATATITLDSAGEFDCNEFFQFINPNGPQLSENLNYFDMIENSNVRQIFVCFRMGGAKLDYSPKNISYSL